MKKYFFSSEFVVTLTLLILLISLLFIYLSMQLNIKIPTKMVSPIVLQKQILFVSDRTGNYQIYRMHLATGETTNITNDQSNNMNPQLSPDGRFIVFYSNRDGDNEIYRMNLQDKTVTKLTDNDSGDYDPAYSPDGQFIVFKSNRYDKLGDIFLMQADGGNQYNITPEMDKTEEWDPSFNHDGTKVIFVSRSNSDHHTDEIFTVSSDGSNIDQLTNNTFSDWYPSLIGEEEKLIYVSKDHKIAEDDIFVSTIQSGKRMRLTNLSGNNADPAWDLKGDQVLFINDSDGDYDLHLINVDGSEHYQIEDTPSDELSPIFLPESI